MRKKKPAKKKSGKKKFASQKKTVRRVRRKKSIQRKKPARFMEPSGNTSAQIHQGVALEANGQSEPRRFPESDAEYGGES
jgi:hypothetical protein